MQLERRRCCQCCCSSTAPFAQHRALGKSICVRHRFVRLWLAAGTVALPSELTRLLTTVGTLDDRVSGALPVETHTCSLQSDLEAAASLRELAVALFLDHTCHLTNDSYQPLQVWPGISDSRWMSVLPCRYPPTGRGFQRLHQGSVLPRSVLCTVLHAAGWLCLLPVRSDYCSSVS